MMDQKNCSEKAMATIERKEKRGEKKKMDV